MAMKQGTIYRTGPNNIALIGNYLPRQCGIATFTTDLLRALADEKPEADCWAMVMNDVPEGYDYPPEVRFELNYKNVSDYRLAADFLNMNQIDVVCLQHEFGIFGGEQGSYILDLIGNLRMPVVTTLHTILKEPSPAQRTIMRRICSISDRVVVLSRRAIDLLHEVYGTPKEKIAFIPHGIPDVPFVDPNYYKDQFGVEGKRVILTFGLLSPDKGIEYMIEAMPRIVERFPDTVYIVLGATHPNIRREQGESYRLSLHRKARELGVGDHLIFHNRFVDIKELCEFLGAADIYVTPYLKREQIVSGTLSYALGTGKAVVSTPYWYAEEMLDEGRGRIVPFCDSEALANEVIDLLSNEVERHAIRKRAYMYCRSMLWKEVARQYLEIFATVMLERERGPRVAFTTPTLDDSPQEMPQVKLDHLVRLTDNVGILQHARFIVPDRYHGYCTDDNARALIVSMLAQEVVPEEENLRNLACIYLAFLNHAFNESSGYFRNFMSYDRRWLEERGSDDSHGRAIWGLGKTVELSRDDNILGAALILFKKALPQVLEFHAPRSCAFAIVGVDAYLHRFPGDSEVRRVLERLGDRLLRMHRDNAEDDWPWLEDILTYANGKIPHAMLLAGRLLKNDEMIESALASLKWLIEIQTSPKGHFIPIGNLGWYRKGGDRARFDQQPLEALHMIEACEQAHIVTGEKSWLDFARTCLEWYLGRNDLNVPLYDYRTGGCCDGLTSGGPNRNQGAESTLAWLLSLLTLVRITEASVESDMLREVAEADKEGVEHAR